jgi:hypothetical protein
MHAHRTHPAHTRMLGSDANAERLAVAAGVAFERIDT